MKKQVSILERIGIILLVSGVAALVSNSVHPNRIPWVQSWSHYVEARAAKQEIKVIPLSVALEKFQSGRSRFIDARSPDRFSDGHIPGALSIPFESFADHFERVGELIDSGRELIVYCQSRDCDDSLMLAAELKSMGAKNLVLYVDGFELWKKHGGEVER
ncbi:MAG TPA: rhodanese-like domain-containing protein [Pontiella sp.]